MKKWALLSGIIAFTAILSLIIAPASTAFSNPFDTQKQLNEFGENVQILLLSHSPIDDEDIEEAEHEFLEKNTCKEAKKQQEKLADKGKQSDLIDQAVEDLCPDEEKD